MEWCAPNKDNTSIKKELPEKYSWWLNELESLGLEVKKANDLNDIGEVSNLTNNIKQVLFQDYKTCYDKEFEEDTVIWLKIEQDLVLILIDCINRKKSECQKRSIVKSSYACI